MITNKKASFEELYPIIQETVEQGNSFSFCAFGRSMLPYIRNGKDLVVLGPTQNPIKRHDVVFYRRDNGRFVLHRVLKVYPDGSCDLCGDNQFSIEKGIRAHQIIAKLIRVERNGRVILPNSFSSKAFCFFLPLRRFYLHVKSSVKHRILKAFKK